MSTFDECYNFIKSSQEELDAIKSFIGILEQEYKYPDSAIDEIKLINCGITISNDTIINMTVNYFNINNLFNEKMCSDNFSFELINKETNHDVLYKYNYRYWITHKPTKLIFILNVNQRIHV